MPYVALATDYDGTLAEDGIVSETTMAALDRLRFSGRKLILVTGRELNDLRRVFSRLDLFDRVVAENGAVLYRACDEEERPLAAKPPPEFAELLRRKHVDPLSVGHVIIATWEPNESKVLEAIRELGLDLQIIFNKGAVMVLPAGINKESGLHAALTDLGLSELDCVAIGDAENDAAFLDICGCPVAVANALPMLKNRAVLTTQNSRGAGVVELIDRVIANDLADVDPSNPRQCIALAEGDPPLTFMPRRDTILLAGLSGGGKSTLTLGLMERLGTAGFSYCVIDPEGDYDGVEDVVTIGDADAVPDVCKVIEILRKTHVSVTVNLMGIELADRPAFFAKLHSELLKLRAATGRPHFIIVDEAHHVLPETVGQSASDAGMDGFMFITTRVEGLCRHALDRTDRLLAVGAEAEATLRAFASAVGLPRPVDHSPLEPNELLTVARGSPEVRRLRGIPSLSTKRRHVRKYAEGILGEDKSFYFRGPGDRLKLRAKNLMDFLDLADGIDEATWSWHRERKDYSQWIKLAIKDQDLHEEVHGIEVGELAPNEARSAMRDAIERRYTLPG